MADSIYIGFCSCDPSQPHSVVSYAVPVVASVSDLPPVAVGTVRPFICTQAWNSPYQGTLPAGLYMQGPSIPTNPLTATYNYYLLNLASVNASVDALAKSTVIWYAHFANPGYTNYPQAQLLGFTYLEKDTVIPNYSNPTGPAMLAFCTL